MSEFPEPWLHVAVERELAQTGRKPSDLRPFPAIDGTEKHFVVGADKQGVLWTLNPYFVDGDAVRVFVSVRFHEAAGHLRGLVHGGATSAIIDAFAAACGALRLGWDLRAVTKEQTVRFLRPVPLETELLLIARSDAGTEGRSAEVHCQIVNKDGETLIESDTIMVIPRTQ